MLNLKNTNILILNIGGYVNLPFSDKKNINSKYTWAEDTWGSLIYLFQTRRKSILNIPGPKILGAH